MKRQKSDNNLKVPSILAKKSRFNQPSKVSYFAFSFNYLYLLQFSLFSHIYFRKLLVAMVLVLMASEDILSMIHFLIHFSICTKEIREDLTEKERKCDTGDNRKLNYV